MALTAGSSRRTSDFARITPSDAGTIVRQIIPTNCRAGVLSTIADSIEIADAFDPGKWGIRLRHDGIMLKAGFVGVLWLRQDGHIYELVHNKLVPAHIRSSRNLCFQKEEFARAPSCDICDFDFRECSKICPALRPAHESAIQIATRSPLRIDTVRDHSCGLVQFISRELGRSLPQPAYRSSAVDDSQEEEKDGSKFVKGDHGPKKSVHKPTLNGNPDGLTRKQRKAKRVAETKRLRRARMAEAEALAKEARFWSKARKSAECSGRLGRPINSQTAAVMGARRKLRKRRK